MHKYLHSYKSEPPRNTWLIFTTELDVYYGVLVHSEPGPVIEQLHQGTQVWSGYFKNMWLKNNEEFYCIYHKQGDPDEELKYINHGNLSGLGTSIKDYIRYYKVDMEYHDDRSTVAYAIKLDPAHKIRYIPHSFGLDDEYEEIVIS